jgi:hypothetical protein
MWVIAGFRRMVVGNEELYVGKEGAEQYDQMRERDTSRAFEACLRNTTPKRITVSTNPACLQTNPACLQTCPASTLFVLEVSGKQGYYCDK